MFKRINVETWARKEYFEHYRQVPCSYSMTVKLDITKLRESGVKIYPAMLYLLAQTVNAHDEFRMSFDEQGNVGIFDEMSPCYTIFHEDTQTFSLLWTEFSQDWKTFLASYEADKNNYGKQQGFCVKEMPENTFDVSMVPWTTFEGFHLGLDKGGDYLIPIFTMGKFYKDGARTMLPLAIQVNHAVCDGFHACRFVNELQERIAEFKVKSI